MIVSMSAASVEPGALKRSQFTDCADLPARFATDRADLRALPVCVEPGERPFSLVGSDLFKAHGASLLGRMGAGQWRARVEVA